MERNSFTEAKQMVIAMASLNRSGEMYRLWLLLQYIRTVHGSEPGDYGEDQHFV